jgi:hypothetical protein
MSTSITSRAVALIAAAAVSLIAAFAMASQADAATLYACVQKEGGSMRLVSQRTKCNSKSERKVSWSTTGPAGKNGANGAAGKNGTNGANGANGANGTNGTNGTNLTTQTPLASGQSETGWFGVGAGSSTSGYAVEGISFAQPLSAKIPEGNVIFNAPGTTTSNCPGFARAARGFVCIYAAEISKLNFLETFDFEFNNNAADKYGFALYFTVSAASAFADGSWTVTAP